MPTDPNAIKLLSDGYFPKELPPPFNTHSFASKIDLVSSDWAGTVASLNAKDRRGHPKLSKPVRFDVARKGHARRLLSIPNPLNQYCLTAFIAAHWVDITSRSNASSLSLTPVNINLSDGRAIELESLSTLTDKRTLMLSVSKSVMQTDVLSYYHSIYTHSIPWALHGKSTAKVNRNPNDPAMYGNRIDELIRSCQDGQTMGIPVGPDTSRIISELILSAVEDQIPQGIKRGFVGGYRYIDDFFICFKSAGDAEAALASIRSAVLHFDLQLNASKTSISNSLDYSEDSWPNDVALNRISNDKNQSRSITQFFSRAIDLYKTRNSESILTFSIRISAKSFISKDNWEIYQSFLFRLARLNSNCLDSVVKIICTYAAIGYPIGDRAGKFVSIMIEEHAPYNHHYEVAWTLWLARSLNIKLDKRCTNLSSSVENSICACLVLLLRSKKLLTGQSNLPSWLSNITSDDLHGEHWLVAYEAGIRKTWRASGSDAAVNGNVYFRSLKRRRVSFFDSRARNRPVDLPGIKVRMRVVLGSRASISLPGLITIDKSDYNRDSYYETLGSNYFIGGTVFTPLFEDTDFDDDNPIDF
jgi:hypothetical protein